MTINKVCGSGLKAVMLAAQAVMQGDAEVAGGRRDGEYEPGPLSLGECPLWLSDE
ncbi:MAG: hypothetical protein ACOX18_06400 [Bacillota bacterium]